MISAGTAAAGCREKLSRNRDIRLKSPLAPPSRPASTTYRTQLAAMGTRQVLNMCLILI